MKKYETPKILVDEIKVEDIILTSIVRDDSNTDIVTGTVNEELWEVKL